MAVQLPNCLAYPVVAFGTLKAGCVVVNTNPLYTGSGAAPAAARRRRVARRRRRRHGRHARGGRPRPGRHAGRAHGDQRLLPRLRARHHPHGSEGVEPVPAPGEVLAHAPALGARAGRGHRRRRGGLPPRAHARVAGMPAVHRRHHRREQGRDADARQPHRQRPPDARLRRRADRGRPRDGAHGPALLPRVRVHGEPARLPPARRAQHPHPQPAPAVEPQARVRELPDHLGHRRQHALPRAHERGVVPRQPAARPARQHLRRHGAALRHRAALAGGHRLPGRRGLRPHRVLPRPDVQPARRRGAAGHRRRAAAEHRRASHARRRDARRARRARRAVGPRPADHGRLLDAARRRPSWSSPTAGCAPATSR